MYAGTHTFQIMTPTVTHGGQFGSTITVPVLRKAHQGHGYRPVEQRLGYVMRPVAENCYQLVGRTGGISVDEVVEEFHCLSTEAYDVAMKAIREQEQRMVSLRMGAYKALDAGVVVR